MILTAVSASVAAFLLGRNSLACGSSACSPSFHTSPDSSKGYKNCTGRSKYDFPARSLAALTTPSRPLISFTMMPRFHFPRFLSSLLMMITSPSLASLCFDLCFRLCRSRSALMYSPVHLDHNTSLHRRRYRALLRKSLSSIQSASSSGIRFGSPCTRMLGVKVGNCRSSSA